MIVRLKHIEEMLPPSVEDAFQLVQIVLWYVSVLFFGEAEQLNLQYGGIIQGSFKYGNPVDGPWFAGHDFSIARAMP
jgi:hypothetical protein